MISLCPPALIYVIFSLTHIIIDTIKGLYNTAFFKFIVAILITILLNGLCKNGLSIISWIIVFIPFIFMTVIVALLLYIFGLNETTGQIYNNTKPKPNLNRNPNLNLNPNRSGNLVFSTIINDDPYNPANL